MKKTKKTPALSGCLLCGTAKIRVNKRTAAALRRVNSLYVGR